MSTKLRKHVLFGIVSLFVLGGVSAFPDSSEASWNLSSLPWVMKIKSTLTRSKINTSSSSGISSGLTGWWSFDGPDMIGGTVFDRSGQGANLSMISMATSTSVTIGRIGQGLHFESGTLDYLEGENLPVYDFGTSDFSVSVWFKTTFAGAGTRLVSKRAVCANDNFWEVAVGAGVFVGCVDGDGSGTTLNCVGSNATVNDDEWHHGVFTRSGSTVSVYVDGVFDNSATGSGVVDLVNSAPIRIANSACNNDYDGSIDDVRIYNRLLSAGEIKRLYTMAR